MPSALRRALPWALGLLGLAALGLLQARPDLLQTLRRGAVDPQQAPCDLARGQACLARFPDGLELRLSASTPLRPGSPAVWTVTASDPDLDLRAIELSGVSMAMGTTVLRAEREGPGRFRAEGALPACGGAAMLWRADLLVQTGERERVAVLQFWTEEEKSAATPRGAALPGAPPPTFGDFTLQTATGPLRLSDLRGQLVMLYFGYTACPDVCPTTLATMGAALRTLTPAQQARVSGLMVSLDPARDTLERLAVYTGHFHERIRGGTVEERELDALTADWGVAWAIAPLPGSAAGYAVDHPTDSLLLDGEGRLLERLPHGMGSEAMAERLRLALGEPGSTR